ncbi:hypothetical protein A3F66_04030 [candidate division TM6 bacterium RIFCSPHIGHO2_12_FULL_32_22]|nr:MAG: hypothetical protein A3F66_04030 [candidate division TM6 bacterium RIFCSPHIGHO2_12_FULL_32_22]
MAKYEVLLLAVPEITKSEGSNIESSFSQVISKIKGRVISWERWGKYLLAYPIEGNDYGVYYLTRFDIPESEAPKLANELKSLLAVKYNDIVMRYLTSRLENETSLEYKKPAPLDETPKGVDEFLKENKMEGLISKDKGEELTNG